MPLQKPPLGLLGALNLKVLGRNPDEFANALQSVYQVNDLYDADLIGQATNTSAGEVAAASINLAVDSAHLWLVRNVSARITYTALSNSAAAQWRHTLQYIPGSGGAQFYLDTSVIETATIGLPIGAADSFSVFLKRTFERPFLMKPGWFFELSSSTVLTAGSYTLDLRCDVIAIPI